MKNLGYGYVPSLYQYVTKEHPFYNPNLKPRMYDPEKAKKLLAEAGYPNGFKTHVDLLCRSLARIMGGNTG